MSIGLGLGVSSGGYKAFSPTQINGLLAWFDYQKNVSVEPAPSRDVTKWGARFGNFQLVPQESNARPQFNDTTGINFSSTAPADSLKLQTKSSVDTSITLDTSDGGFCIALMIGGSTEDVDGVYFGDLESSDTSLVTGGSDDPVSFILQSGGIAKTYEVTDYLGGTTIDSGDVFSLVFNSSNQGVTRAILANVVQSGHTNTADITISVFGGSDSTTNFNGTIKEIIIYDKQLTNVELTRLYNYMKRGEIQN